MQNDVSDMLKQAGLNINERGELVPMARNASALVIPSKDEDKPLIGGFLKVILVLSILVGSYFLFGLFPVLAILIALLISHL